MDYSCLAGHVCHGLGIRRKTSQGLAHELRAVGLNIAYRQYATAIASFSFSGVPPSPLKEPLSYIAYLFTPWTAKEKEGLARTRWFQSRGRGYFAEQTTQPQTLGYSLADSPVGLLAWIYEKLHHWTDNYPWEDDEGMQDGPCFLAKRL